MRLQTANKPKQSGVIITAVPLKWNRKINTLRVINNLGTQHALYVNYCSFRCKVHEKSEHLYTPQVLPVSLTPCYWLYKFNVPFPPIPLASTLK
jgi:hypothetical protein